MNPLILTRHDLQKAYADNPIEAITLNMFSVPMATLYLEAAVLFIDSGRGGIRLCKIIKDRIGEL